MYYTILTRFFEECKGKTFYIGALKIKWQTTSEQTLITPPLYANMSVPKTDPFRTTTRYWRRKENQ